MEVHIYIGTDSKAPKSCTRKYGYVLECNLRGTPWTKEKFGEAAGTYHSIVLRALIEAMKRLTKPTEIISMIWICNPQKPMSTANMQ